ncbi:hypothetical protein [Actinokineospora sp. UTMC 2448]|uniref:ATP dependent DNA ligase n=1 Tax=Actinokineospora sp. UTMC 2448 TaxID=2268449 RepID=UPI00216426E3|nr:hypothetical protein [Actinokineospora sp. UTMC 2448]
MSLLSTHFLDQDRAAPHSGGRHRRLDPGEGRRTARPGGLLLGVHDQADGRLRYVGNVSTGFTQHTLDDLQNFLHELPATPARSTTSCPPSTHAGPAGSSPGWSVRWSIMSTPARASTCQASGQPSSTSSSSRSTAPNALRKPRRSTSRIPLV